MKNILGDKLIGESKFRNVIILYIFTLLIVLLGTSKSIFSVYMPDDYLLSSEEMPISFYLNQGRFIQAIITAWFNYSNINIISSSSIFTPIFIMLVACSASIFVYTLSDNRMPLITACLLSGVIVCHPVFSMMAVYHLSTIHFSIGSACFCMYMLIFKTYSINYNYKELALLILLIIVICGTYQSFFVTIIIFTISHILIKGNFNLTIKDIYKIFPIISGFLLYLVIFKLTKNLAGYNNWDNRAGLLTNISERINDIFSFIPSLFYSDWWLISWQFNMMLSIGMIITFVTFIFWKTSNFIIPRILLSIFVFFITILPIAILKGWDPTPRAMFSISFSYVVVMILFFNTFGNKVKCFIMSLIVFLGLISSNNYLYITEINQKSDEAMVQSVYAMLNSKDITNKKIYIVNENSIKVAPWALNGIFYFNTGNNYNISSASTSEIEECSLHNIRPYLVDNNDKIIICLY